MAESPPVWFPCYISVRGGGCIPPNTFKNGRRERYIHFGGRTAFHDECGLQCARCFYLRLTKTQPFQKGGSNLRK